MPQRAIIAVDLGIKEKLTPVAARALQMMGAALDNLPRTNPLEGFIILRNNRITENDKLLRFAMRALQEKSNGFAFYVLTLKHMKL